MATHIALGPARRASSCAPHASAAAVPSGRGSTSTFSSGTSRVTERIAGAMSRLVRISTRSGGIAGCSRPTVSSISVCSETSASNGLGRAGVDSGQNREPMPPANTTAQSATSVSGSENAANCSAGRVPAAEPPGGSLGGRAPKLGIEDTS